jgi:hypothetical protein
MKKFKTNEELVEWIETMHLQNTNGRETEQEMFRLGIEAAIEELTELNLLNTPVIRNQRKLLNWMKKNHHLALTEDQISRCLFDYTKQLKKQGTLTSGQDESKLVNKYLSKQSDTHLIGSPLEIELIDWDNTCGDGCCYTWGQDITLNGEKLDEQNAEDSKNALTVILNKLGYKVEINQI